MTTNPGQPQHPKPALRSRHAANLDGSLGGSPVPSSVSVPGRGHAANPGQPQPLALLRDGVKATLAQPVASIAAALVVALVCLVVLVTAGRTAATEAQVLASIDDAGTRLITVIDTTGDAGLHPDTVTALASLPGVSWAIGLGPASDAVIETPGTVTGRITTGIPVRELIGTLPAGDAPLTGGRLPQRPGEAIASTSAATTLGLLDNAGPITTGALSASVVGVSDLTGALRPFANTVLVQAEPRPGLTLRFVYLVADKATDVPAIADLARAALHAANPSQVAIETPDGVLALQNMISGQLGASSRQLMAAILAVGVAVVSVTTLGMVATKRRDFGRRRALGASRSAIIILVLVQAGIAAITGAIIGTGAGIAILAATTGHTPTPTYLAGLATLAILAALAGTIPPAITAANRDPVRILRVP